MVSTESVVLGVHIVAGFTILGAGGGALLTKKGGPRHRRFGRVFVGGMGIVSATAVLLLVLEVSLNRVFLGMVAIFSVYLAFSGYRTLSRKRPVDSAAPIDWVAGGLMLGAGVGLLGLGVWLFTQGNSFAIVVVLFGTIGGIQAGNDLRSFRSGTAGGSNWIQDHLGRMIAAYIAAVTAFSAVNFTMLPLVARWLWPTVLGTPLIVYLSRKYAPPERPAESTADTN